MACKSAVRSEGAQKLGRVGKTQQEIARRCGVTQSAVSQWRSGSALPTIENRRLLATLYGIDFDAWDRPAHTASAPAAVEAAR